MKTKRKNKCYIDNQLTVEKDGTNYLSCLHTDKTQLHKYFQESRIVLNLLNFILSDNFSWKHLSSS